MMKSVVLIILALMVFPWALAAGEEGPSTPVPAGVGYVGIPIQFIVSAPNDVNFAIAKFECNVYSADGQAVAMCSAVKKNEKHWIAGIDLGQCQKDQKYNITLSIIPTTAFPWEGSVEVKGLTAEDIASLSAVKFKVLPVRARTVIVQLIEKTSMQPITNQTVNVFLDGPNSSDNIFSGTTNQDGKISIPVLEARKYSIYAGDGGSVPTDHPVSTSLDTNQDQMTWTISIPPIQLDGELRDTEGTVLSEFWGRVNAFDVARGNRVGWTFIRNGRFALRQLPPGKYRLEVEPAGGRKRPNFQLGAPYHFEIPITLTAPMSVHLRMVPMAPRKVDVTVIDADTGKPVVCAIVRTSGQSGKMDVKVNAQGTVQLALNDDDYGLFVSAEGYDARNQQIQVTQNEALTVTLEPVHQLEIQVLSQKPDVIDTTRFTLFDHTWSREITSGNPHNHLLSLRGIPKGQYYLTAYSWTGVLCTKSIRMEGVDAKETFTLEAGRTVGGIVRSETFPEGWNQNAVLTVMNVAIGRNVATAEIDPETKQFSFSALPGSYKISLRTGEKALAECNFTIPEKGEISSLIIPAEK